MVLSEEAKVFLVKKGLEPRFRRRPLRRALENFVEDPLSEELLKGEFQGKNTIMVEIKDVGEKKHLVFHGTTGEEPPLEPQPVAAAAGGESTGSGTNT